MTAVLVVALLLLQVLPFLSRRWVTDESWYAAAGYSVAQGHGLANPAIGPNDLEHTIDARPPGTALVMAAVFRLFRTGVVQARVGSVLAAVLAVLLTYRLARRRPTREGALAAALVMATDTFLVAAGRTARPEALTTAAVLAALVAMTWYADRAKVVWAALSGLLMAAATMCHITMLGWLISVGVYAVVLDRRRGRFPLRGALFYAAGYLAGLLPFALWILSSAGRRLAFRGEYLSRGTSQALRTRLLNETGRYRDLLGFHTLTGHGLEAIPVRLPVVLVFLLGLYVLWTRRRDWFYAALLFAVPTMLWFVNLVNRSARYTALLSPVFALTVGAAVAAAPAGSRQRRWMLNAAGLMVALQLMGNVLLLVKARQANYEKMTAELNRLVPAGEPVFGTMTLWLGMRDHPFISYERTTMAMAEQDDHVRYFVLGDPMMKKGLETEPEFYRQLNADAAALAGRSELVGTARDPYYGELEVYRLPDGTGK